MRIFILATALAGSVISAALAETVAPADVVFKDGAVEQSLTGMAGDPAEGRSIVGNKKRGNCVACHQFTDLSDIPFQGNVGPTLDGAGGRWTEAELRGIVVNAKKMFEGTIMPSFYKVDGFVRPGKGYTGKAADDTFAPVLSAQDIEHVVAYLATLKD